MKKWWKHLSVILYLLFCCFPPCLTWGRFLNFSTHNIQATWISICRALQGEYVRVHVYVLYMWVPDVCMSVSETSAAGYKSCVGGLSLMCVVVFVWGAQGAENRVQGLQRKGLLVHEPGPMCHVYRPNTAVEYTSPLMHMTVLLLRAKLKLKGIVRYQENPTPASLL